MNSGRILSVILFAAANLLWSQSPAANYDSTAVARIRDEALNRSRVMHFLATLTDVYGPRLTGSPSYMEAAQWTRGQLAEMGLAEARLEAWGPWGRGWTLKSYSANVSGRQNFPLLSLPRAWSPSLEAPPTELIHLDAATDSALATFKGKLKGKMVLIGDPRELEMPFQPYAWRKADSTLLKLANSDGQRRGGRRFERTPEMRQRQLLSWRKLQLCFDEGAKAILYASGRNDGIIDVGAVSYPRHPDSLRSGGTRLYSVDAPRTMPQISVAIEHFNRLVRMLEQGERPRLAIELETAFNRADSGYNIIAEIPGTDLRDQIVMIGGHFDSWHGGTGAVDNASGVAVAMEAMRILKRLGLQPRRTIRIGLWDAEEWGYLGSRGYISKHLAVREGGSERDAFMPAPGGKIVYTPEGEKFSAYFNMDNGCGKFRGIYLQGNEACRTIFRSWLRPFNDLGAATVSLNNTGGTDHQAFDGLGLPGFQFIQDDLDYMSRVHHGTLDLLERCPEEDLRQAAAIMAAFAYNTAMRDELLPRKPLPAASGSGPAGAAAPDRAGRRADQANSGPKQGGVMITDRLENADKYVQDHPAFARAFAFLRQEGLAALAPGRHEIDGDRLFCMIMEGPGKGRGGEKRLEAHRKYIDIQYVMAGTDDMGWKPVAQCLQPAGDFDLQQDIGFFHDAVGHWQQVPAGSFAIFYPGDAHAPMGGEGTIRKAVVKVAVE